MKMLFFRDAALLTLHVGAAVKSLRKQDREHHYRKINAPDAKTRSAVHAGIPETAPSRGVSAEQSGAHRICGRTFAYVDILHQNGRRSLRACQLYFRYVAACNCVGLTAGGRPGCDKCDRGNRISVACCSS